MNSKQLAEMVKRLRKEKQDELAMTDMNTTSSMKGVTHDIAERVLKEYRSRSMVGSNPRKGALLPDKHIAHSKQTDITKAGPGLQNKYRPGKMVSEKEQVSNTKSTIINTTPEQDSAMIGTQ